jgi:very-short-patch-repair endonuclease
MYSDPTADAALNDESDDVELDEGTGLELSGRDAKSPLKSFLADYVGRADNPIPIKALLGYPGEITSLNHAVTIIEAYANTLSAETKSVLQDYQRELAAEKARPYEKDFRDKVLAPDWKFQHIIGPYIVDFCRGKTVIELDGGDHQREEQKFLDEIRDKYLERCDYTVRRLKREHPELASRDGKDTALRNGLIDKDWIHTIN